MLHSHADTIYSPSVDVVPTSIGFSRASLQSAGDVEPYFLKVAVCE